jgi:hypothetical protein
VLIARGQHTVHAIATRLRMSMRTVRAIQHRPGWATDPDHPVVALLAA